MVIIRSRNTHGANMYLVSYEIKRRRFERWRSVLQIAVVALMATAIAAERLENTYLPPSGAQGSGGNGNFLAAPFGRQGPSAAAPAGSYGAPSQASGRSSEPPAAILRYNNDNNGEGAYRFE